MTVAPQPNLVARTPEVLVYIEASKNASMASRSNCAARQHVSTPQLRSDAECQHSLLSCMEWSSREISQVGDLRH